MPAAPAAMPSFAIFEDSAVGAADEGAEGTDARVSPAGRNQFFTATVGWAAGASEGVLWKGLAVFEWGDERHRGGLVHLDGLDPRVIPASPGVGFPECETK